MKLQTVLKRGVCLALSALLISGATVLPKEAIAMGETTPATIQTQTETTIDLNGTWGFWPDLAGESTVITNSDSKTATVQTTLSATATTQILNITDASVIRYGKISALVEIAMDAFADKSETPLLFVSVNGNPATSVSLEGKDVGRKMWIDLPLNPAELVNGDNTLTLTASPADTVKLYGNSKDNLCVRIEYFNAVSAAWQDIAVPGAWEGNFEIQKEEAIETVTGNTPVMGVTVNQTGGSMVDLTAYLGQTNAQIEVPLSLSQLKTGDNTFVLATNTTTGGGQKDDYSVDIFYHTTADGADVSGTGTYATNTAYSACTTNVPAVTLQLKNRQGNWVTVSEHTDQYIGSVICGIFGRNSAGYQSQSTLAIDNISLYTEAKLTVLANVGSQLNVTSAAEGMIPSDSTEGMVPVIRMVTNDKDYTLINARQYAGLDKPEIQIPVDVDTLQAGANTFRLGANVTAVNGQCNGTSIDVYYYTTASGADVTGNGTWDEGAFSQGTTNVPAATLHLKKADGTWETLSHYTEPAVGSVVTGIYSANNHNYQSQAAFTVADPTAYTEAYLSVIGHVGLFATANAATETLLPQEVIPPYLQLGVNGTEEAHDLSAYAGKLGIVEVPLSFDSLTEGDNVFVFNSNVTNKGQGQGNTTSIDLVLATPKTSSNTGTGYWENNTFKQFAANEDFNVTLCLQRKDNDEWVTVCTHNGDNAGKNLLVGTFASSNASYRPQVTLSVENLSDYKAAKLQAFMNVGNALECSKPTIAAYDYDSAAIHTVKAGEPLLRVGVNTTEDWTIQGLQPYAGTTSDVMVPLSVSALTKGDNTFYLHTNALNGGNRTANSADIMIEQDTAGYKDGSYSQDGLNTYIDLSSNDWRFKASLALKEKATGKWIEIHPYSEDSATSIVVGKYNANGLTYVPRITLPVDDPSLYSDAVFMAKLHVGEEIQVEGSDTLSYDGVGWYNRTITVPENVNGTEQLLHFEAIDYLAEIFINGVFIGSHEGGYAPFDLSLKAAGDAVNYGGENTLTVRVTDQSTDLVTGKIPIKETPAGFLQDTIAINYAGIWGDVSLVTRGTVYTDHLYIDTDIDNGIATFNATVYNPGTTDRTVNVKADVLQKATGEANGSANTSVTLKAGESKQISIPVTLTECTLWQIDNPHLYTANLTVSGDGITADTLTETFGMRRIERDGKQILFNGNGIFLTGWITWDVEWDTIAPIQTEEEVRKQITDLKNYGFNAIKYCLVVPPDYVLDICDEMGIYVYIEYPIWEPQVTEDFLTRCYTQIPELVEKDRNHPSVIMSDFACELISYTPEMDTMLKYLVDSGKEIDPNRLYTENSTVHVNKYGDFRTFHPYASLTDFDRYVDHCAASRGNYPVILGEYADSRTMSKYQDIVEASGGEEPWWWDATNPPPNTYAALKALGFSEEQIEKLQDASYASSQEAKRGYMEASKSNPYVSGLFLTQLVDIKHNTCGFYDELGNLKYDADELKGSAGETALLIDDQVNQKRNFVAGRQTTIAPAISHFNGKDFENGTLSYTVTDGDTVVLSGTIQDNISLKAGSYYTLDELKLTLPETDSAKQYVLTFTLECDAFTVDNHWDIWGYPDENLRSNNKTVAYYDPDALYDFQKDYPWMTGWTDGSTPDAVITTAMTDGIEAYLNAGGKVIYLGGGTGPVPGTSDREGFTNFTSSSLIFFPDETHPLVTALDSNGYGGVQFIPLTSPMVQPYKADGVTGNVIFGRICHGGETYSYLSEYTVGSGTLLQCSLRLHKKATAQVAAGENPLGSYLVDQMLRYTLGEVEEAALTELTVTAPTKTEYIKGDALDLTGITAKVKDANGTEYTLSADDLDLSGYDANTLGEQTVTATYKGLTATFTVTVIDPVAEAQKEVAAKIDAIGAVTEENYKEKAQVITDAEAALKVLTDTYGETADDAIADKVAVLTEARRLYDEFVLQAAIIYGDVNGDKAIDAKDALMILQAAVDKITLTETQTVVADVNGDKAIDAKDALLVLQKAVDKIEKFPVEN